MIVAGAMLNRINEEKRENEWERRNKELKIMLFLVVDRFFVLAGFFFLAQSTHYKLCAKKTFECNHNSSYTNKRNPKNKKYEEELN
jgi:hypothetical protein